MGGASLKKLKNGDIVQYSVVILLFVHKVLTDNLPALKIVCGGLLLSMEAWKYYLGIYLYHSALNSSCKLTTIPCKTWRQVPPLPQW